MRFPGEIAHILARVWVISQVCAHRSIRHLADTKRERSLAGAVGGIRPRGYLVSTRYTTRNCVAQDVGICLASKILTPQKGRISVAQKVQVLLVDDIDGSEATETVSFGLDGVGYEIDLSSGNAGGLRTELAQYVEHARKSGGAQVRRRRQRNGAGREQSARIREWARSHGHKVNERGRIPANIVAEYEAAH